MNNLPTVFASLLAILGLLVYKFLYVRYVLDKTRQRLFALRGDLFDLAVSGKLEFESELFKFHWESLNDAIRYCHRATFAQLLVRRFFIPNSESEERVWRKFVELRNRLAAETPIECRDALASITIESTRALLRHQLQTSLCLLFVVYPIVFLAKAYSGVLRIMAWLGRRMDVVTARSANLRQSIMNSLFGSGDFFAKLAARERMNTTVFHYSLIAAPGISRPRRARKRMNTTVFH